MGSEARREESVFQKDQITYDKLRLRSNSQLSLFFESIGETTETLLYSDVADVRQADSAFLDEVSSVGTTGINRKTVSVTLVVTNLNIYCFPPMVEVANDKFLVCNTYERYRLQDLLLVSLPYRDRSGGSGAESYALRSDDFVLHYIFPSDDDQPKYQFLWLCAPAGYRPLVAEVVCDAYESLLGIDIDVHHPSCADLVTWLMTGQMPQHLKEAWAHISFHPAVILEGWLANYQISDKKKRGSIAKKKRGELAAVEEDPVWSLDYFVLTRDHRLLMLQARSHLNFFRRQNVGDRKKQTKWRQDRSPSYAFPPENPPTGPAAAATPPYRYIRLQGSTCARLVPPAAEFSGVSITTLTMKNNTPVGTSTYYLRLPTQEELQALDNQESRSSGQLDESLSLPAAATPKAMPFDQFLSGDSTSTSAHDAGDHFMAVAGDAASTLLPTPTKAVEGGDDEVQQVNESYQVIAGELLWLSRIERAIWHATFHPQKPTSDDGRVTPPTKHKRTLSRQVKVNSRRSSVSAFMGISTIPPSMEEVRPLTNFAAGLGQSAAAGLLPQWTKKTKPKNVTPV